MKKFDCRFEAAANTLFISADFAKKASDTRSAEYRHCANFSAITPA